MYISFVLVEPKVPENIGAAARAMKTMGFNRLCLVKPCEYLTGKARWLAHGSEDILDNAEVFTSLEAALGNNDLVIGTTARYRISKSEYIDLSRLRSFLEERHEEYNKIALVFGREEYGLSNEEMELCDITSTISMAVSYPSLNLAQAVMIYSYMLSEKTESGSIHNERGPGNENLRLLKDKIESLLSGTTTGKNKALKGRIMERLSLAKGKDIRLIHSITNSLINKYEKGQK
ncbi:MAG: tRNA/rRNA methyltransferase [Bacteroidota bacterium]|nr:tRNA/rRNA methyltransferase [Bacteroidota bacterium]